MKKKDEREVWGIKAGDKNTDDNSSNNNKEDFLPLN